jgi:hypothetical protein
VRTACVSAGLQKMDRLFVELAAAVITLQFTVSGQIGSAVLFQIQMSYTN